MLRWWIQFRHGQKGQSMSEYALLLALLAILGIVGLVVLGPRLRDVFERIAQYLELQ